MPSRANRPYASTPEQQRNRAQRFDSARRDEIRKLYGTARWKAQSTRCLAENPICQGCHQSSSTVADHIVHARVYIRQHNGDVESFFDPSNLQGLCADCHAKKTSRECAAAGTGVDFRN